MKAETKKDIPKGYLHPENPHTRFAEVESSAAVAPRRGALLAAKISLLLLSSLASAAAYAFDMDFFGKLIAIPSVSADIGKVNDSMRAMRDYLAGRGVCCTMETAPDGREILYASTTPGKRHDFVISVHLDVVAPGTPTQFTLKRNGDRVEGRGVNDCKGYAVVAAEVLSALVGKGVSVACLFGPDEEIGGAGTRWMVEKKGFVPQKMVIVIDSAYGQVCYAHKGQTYVGITARGRSGHSSRPWNCDDSITKVMLGYAKIREEWDRRHPLPDDKWSDVLVPTVVHADGGALNMIPPEMKLILNLRSVNPGAKDELMELCKSVLPDCEVKLMRHSPPVNSIPNHPLIAHLRKTMTARLGHDIPLSRMLAATDARWFTGCGVPIALIGAKGGGAHAVDEHAYISSLDDMAEYLKMFFLEASK